VASRAFLRRRLIKQHRFAAHHLNILVAGLAAHILMRASQRERRSAFVVKQRWLPFETVVTVGAGSDFVGIRELRPVDIFVALLALGRSRLEIGLHQLGPKVRRLVAIDAGGPAMRPQQWE